MESSGAISITKIYSFVLRTCYQERCRILLRFADLLEKHADEITALEVWDNGKPYEQAATDEIPLFIRLFRYYAGKQSRMQKY